MSFSENSGDYLSHNAGVLVCPACGGNVQPGHLHCLGCGFTGADSMMRIPFSPPPFTPLIDAADTLSAAARKAVEAQMKRITARFPQFQWRVVLADLSHEVDLSVFGFWLLNACSLGEQETAKQRAWTVLLVVNSATAQATVVCGYAAEPYVSDNIWKIILGQAAGLWKAADPVPMLLQFFKLSRQELRRTSLRYRVLPGRKGDL